MIEDESVSTHKVQTDTLFKEWSTTNTLVDSSQIMEILKMHVSQMILLKSNFFVFNSEVVKIKSNAAELQSDNVELEGEVSDMKEEIPELKLNNAELKSVNKKFKSEVWSTTKDIQCAKSL